MARLRYTKQRNDVQVSTGLVNAPISLIVYFYSYGGFPKVVATPIAGWSIPWNIHISMDD